MTKNTVDNSVNIKNVANLNVKNSIPSKEFDNYLKMSQFSIEKSRKV
jgi:hypothetical protein